MASFSLRSFLALTLAASPFVSADTLLLQNGTRLNGSFLGGDSRTIRFAVGNQVNTYVLPDVNSLSFDSNTGTAANPNGQAGTNGSAGSPSPYGPPSQTQGPYSPPAGSVASAPSPTPSSPPPPTNAIASVPAGSQVVVRLIDAVNSETDSLGQTYRASLDQPIVVDGQTVLPRGADAIATLIDAQKSGRIQGRTVLTLDLKSISVNGRSYDIVTTGVSQASSSRGARSAKVIGGTTALGAIIGGIAGGGRGAAIGAGSGAAVGTAAEVATSGQKVKVPSETRLTFTLQNPIAL